MSHSKRSRTFLKLSNKNFIKVLTEKIEKFQEKKKEWKKDKNP